MQGDVKPLSVCPSCPSHIERKYLTIHTSMPRFTRLCLGFSKKLENLRAPTALLVFHYNFCRIHRSIRMSPALKAGFTDRLWKVENCSG